jgi:hypothetical protein
MGSKYFKIILKSLFIAAIGVLVIDYFFHLFFSNPMETPPYFMAKMTLYFVFSLIFLSNFNLEAREFFKVAAAGVIVASTWGIYYNILPALFGFSPFGIPLAGLTFLGMGLFGTGVAFGTVHVLAFIGGYYAVKFIFKG